MTPDDDPQFEAELKRFTPRAAPPLQLSKASPMPLRSRWAARMAVAAVLVIVLSGALVWYTRDHAELAARSSDETGRGVTLGRAEAALAQDSAFQNSSFDDALDRLDRAAWPQPKSKPAEHFQSALQALGKEEL
ncbi:MAG TPA: hypothetical protein VKY85_02435 [Candidatus Angelobacter sp.]|nr:hypothetical protein [Candidatus Angelobacter sp.]